VEVEIYRFWRGLISRSAVPEKITAATEFAVRETGDNASPISYFASVVPPQQPAILRTRTIADGSMCSKIPRICAPAAE
jgi:hypothetical protein